jgi:hypothetical protein
MRRLLFGFLATFALAPLACAAPSSADEASAADGTESNDALTSKDAQIVDDVFRGEVLAARDEDAKKAIVRQLFYVVGPLTLYDHANAQVGRVTLTDISERIENGKKLISYAARLPVAWPRASRVPTSQQLVLPRDLSASAVDAVSASVGDRSGSAFDASPSRSKPRRASHFITRAWMCWTIASSSPRVGAGAASKRRASPSRT